MDLSQRLPWHQTLWQQVAQAIANQRLAHGLLITGPSGAGKHLFAQQLVQILFCQQQQNNACGHCAACQQWQAQTHPDFSQLQPEKAGQFIKVAAVRDFINRLQLTPQYATGRIGWIEPAEQMNRSAANALLKTLEEPAGQTRLILISHHADQLLPTIRSRCSVLRVPPAPIEMGKNWLQEQGIDISAVDEDFFRTPLKVQRLQNDEQALDLAKLEKQLASVLARRADIATAAEAWAKLPAQAWASWLYRSASRLLTQQLTHTGITNPQLAQLATKLPKQQLITLATQAQKLMRLETTNADWRLQIEAAFVAVLY